MNIINNNNHDFDIFEFNNQDNFNNNNNEFSKKRRSDALQKMNIIKDILLLPLKNKNYYIF